MAVQWLKRLSCSGGRPRGGAPRFRPALVTLENRVVPAVDAILEWNDVMLRANANDHSLAAPEQGGPILTARAFAIVSAAMYDAYNSVEAIGDPYLVTAPNARHADADAAVAQAAHDTLVALFPSQRPLFDAELQETLARIPNNNRETHGRAVGAYVAGHILAARADDGVGTIGTPAYAPVNALGFHGVDPLHAGQGFYAPHADAVAPFAMLDSDQFAARSLDDGTPAGRMAFLQSQEYADAFNELVALGSDGVSTPTERTAEQTEIGIYWAYDGRPGLGTPPRLYNQIARTLAAQERNSEAENARMFALVNIAMSDAGCTCWDDKYENQFWRPVLGLRAGDLDGNPATDGDAGWTPLGAPASNPRPGETDFTPPFPAYTSGHATFGAAAFQTLARFFGRDDIAFSFTSDELNGVTRDADGSVRPAVTRSFASLTEAKLENAQSRIYLGIHWRFDADDGVHCGDHVADYVFDHILRPKGHGNGNANGHDNDPGNGNGNGHKAVTPTAGESQPEPAATAPAPLVAAPVASPELAVPTAQGATVSSVPPPARGVTDATDPTPTLHLVRSQAESPSVATAAEPSHDAEPCDWGDVA